jgi:hypothetical protein
MGEGKDRPPLGEMASRPGRRFWTEIAPAALGSFRPGAVTHAARKRMRRDGQIALGLAAIKAPLMDVSWCVECADAAVAAVVEAVLAPVWREVMRSSLNAVDFGFQAHEKVWAIRPLTATDRDGRRHTLPQAAVLQAVRDLDPEYVTMLADETGRFAGFRYGGASEGVVVPAEKAYVVSFGKEWGDLYGTSRLDAAYEPWYWASVMYLFCNRYFERKADPAIVATGPAEERVDAHGVATPALEHLNRLAANLRGGGTVTLPYEPDEATGRNRWAVEYLLDDKRADQFLEYLNHLQALKLRSVLVPERVLTQDAATGTQAMARTHTDTFLRMEETLLADLADHVNQFLAPQVVRYNFGPDAPPATVRLGPIADGQEEYLRRIVAEALASKPEVAKIADWVKLLSAANVPM